MMGGLGTQVATVVQPPAFGYDPTVTPYPYDPKKAKELLAQAGYPNGVDITAAQRLVEFRPVFEAIGQMLTEVGLRTTPEDVGSGPGLEQVLPGARARPPTAHYGTWGNYSVFDADAVLHPLYHTEPGGWIGKHYARVEGLDKLIDEARSTRGPAAAQADLRADPAADPRGGAVHLPVHPVRHARHLEEGRRTQARGDEWLWLFDAKPQEL